MGSIKSGSGYSLNGGGGGGGTGDVVGPASSTDNAYVIWDGVTGKLIKDSDIIWTSGTYSGTYYTGMTANVVNADLILAPNGTGAIQAQVADGTAVGGNVRGNYAVDLQRSRGNATRVASGSYSVIGGGRQNTASGNDSTVGGGGFNTASNIYSTVAGGVSNWAASQEATVGGGSDNTAAGRNATIGGGDANGVTGQYSVVSGGFNNSASGGQSTVSGGQSNAATNTHSTIGGGWLNTASGVVSTVSGGRDNDATNSYSTVGGGFSNTATNTYSTVSGGESNTASGSRSTVGGGRQNTASGLYSTVIGGNNNTASNNAGVTGGQNNINSGLYSAVFCADNTVTSQQNLVGGRDHNVGGNGFNLVGGRNNTTSGINKEYCLVVGNSNTSSSSYNVVSGGFAAASTQNERAQGLTSQFGGVGGAQYSRFVLWAVTADATPTELRADFASSGAIAVDERITLPDRSGYQFHVQVVARERSTTGTDSAWWDIKGCVTRDVGAGTVTLVGTNIVATSSTPGAAAWVFTVTADTVNGSLKLEATGDAATDVKWLATVHTSKVVVD